MDPNEIAAIRFGTIIRRIKKKLSSIKNRRYKNKTFPYPLLLYDLKIFMICVKYSQPTDQIQGHAPYHAMPSYLQPFVTRPSRSFSLPV